MLTEVKNSFKFLLVSLKYNIKSSMEYKKSFLIQTIFMIMNNGFFLIFWFVVFDINNGNVNGLEMKDILYLWSIPVASWGFANFLFGGLRELNRYIISGSLDTYLLQPKNVILSIATSKCDFSAFGDILYGLVIGMFAVSSSVEYLQLLMYMFFGTIITASTFILVRVLAIWLGEVENIANIYENSLLITFCTYPYEIFGGFVKFLMFTIAPATYIVHLPIKIIGNFDIRIFLIIVLATGFYAGLASFIFNKSLKRYESGNNIAMKE